MVKKKKINKEQKHKALSIGFGKGGEHIEPSNSYFFDHQDFKSSKIN